MGGDCHQMGHAGEQDGGPFQEEMLLVSGESIVVFGMGGAGRCLAQVQRVISVQKLAAIPVVLSRKIWRVETQPQFSLILEYDSYQHSKASKDVCLDFGHLDQEHKIQDGPIFVSHTASGRPEVAFGTIELVLYSMPIHQCGLRTYDELDIAFTQSVLVWAPKFCDTAAQQGNIKLPHYRIWTRTFPSR
ncbi:hypothetical protein SNOG_12717 [Parastagonospora nodorum SN15]|uniref:Uncharacterized protein n=1 Tax=Phaeosphaeria nodorum (strain SN15 / ATCC MYA-4574 / FGSC 10173) TaxID=321614 RepID=Q0U697_PHANO|nr:hypothetical protein SNOG_12717 [Parastagonospora nodorum SN15]EAT80015.1 hypothetical protein SNOG_12717 [Parastagonospora nodorum SN15]